MNKFTEAWQDEGHLIASGLSTTLHACRPTAGKPLAVQARVHAHTSSRAHTHTNTQTYKPPTHLHSRLAALAGRPLVAASSLRTNTKVAKVHP